MANLQTVKDVLARLQPERVPQLPPPKYSLGESSTLINKVGLAVESMKYHMSNEGWEIFNSLNFNGWTLAGHKLETDIVDVPTIIERTTPHTVLVQDIREWDYQVRDFRDPMARFHNVGYLSSREDIFKGTILKDAQQRPNYHRDSAADIGCNYWVIYYNKDIVCKLCTYIRPQHVVRTYHTLDPVTVAPYTPIGRRGCLLSGAVSGAYPLRNMLVKKRAYLRDTDYLAHPGYHRNGCMTAKYLWTLARFKVAICTSSLYGYALRKIIEATAAGCMVITDLPVDEVMPEIDGNMVRVHPSISLKEMDNLIQECLASYDPEKQEDYVNKAIRYYDYKLMGMRLSRDIENLRLSYNN